MPRLCALLLAAGLAGAGEDFGRALRALAAEERERRVAALEAFAGGSLAPEDRAGADRLEASLRRFLSDRFPGDERALAVRALGRIARPRGFLDRLARERDDRVLRAAAEALARGPESLLADLLDRARSEDPVERAIWYRMIGALPGTLAREEARKRSAAEPEWVGRAALALAMASDRAAAPLLVEWVADEHPGVAAAAAEALGRMTRLPHGRDAAKWKQWWAAGGEMQPLKPAGEETRTAAEPAVTDTGPNYYFGIPVRGRKVVFCCDVSASMRYKLPLAYDQLTRAVMGLPSTAQFEVIFFNEFIWPWRERFSWADPVTKELLCRHLPTIEIKSYTNLYDSLERALSLAPDEVFLISDGEPNRGRYRTPQEILDAIPRINPRGVPIHTISVVRVVDGDEHPALLRQIAERTRGEHVERTLK